VYESAKAVADLAMELPRALLNFMKRSLP
jgi:hypothetical protein